MSRFFQLSVREMGFARTFLAYGNIWFEKGKDKRVEDEEHLIPRWPCGHPWYAAAAVLPSVTKGKSCQFPVSWFTRCIRTCRLIRKMQNIISLGYCYL